MTPAKRRTPTTSAMVTRTVDAQPISEVDYLHLVLDNRTIERDDLARQIAERNAQLAEMLGSTSWRLTKGFRQLSTGLRSEVIPRLSEELGRSQRLVALAEKYMPSVGTRLSLSSTSRPAASTDRAPVLEGDEEEDEELDIEPYLRWVREFDDAIDEDAIRSY
ncbi:MAG: hypothetical protein ACP5HZ_12865, partial [Ferrimicrobium sp.]